eukprot:TRINITY_DN23530_c0_g1_i1.p1 TRINITY_DN23530_c0_g1~~TRINITY_DN23530_c0_g1_i1.p1  ORF type:complete len:242 (+),score=59.32 TRINITY_DN23530_c0_g1_i1:54-728(+)
MISSRVFRAARVAHRHGLRAYCEPPKEAKEVPATSEDELTAHFRLPQKGEGPEKVVYDLAEKVLSLNVLQFRLFQKIINEAMGKSEMWEYDLVMNMSKALAGGGGGGGGGAFMMNPGMMQMQMQMPAAGAPAGGAAPAEEAPAEAEPEPAKAERTEFDVKLTQIDPEKKVKTIKVLKDVLKMSLKDSKDKIEALPSVLATGLPKEEAEALKVALAEVGASASLV